MGSALFPTGRRLFREFFSNDFRIVDSGSGLAGGPICFCSRKNSGQVPWRKEALANSRDWTLGAAGGERALGFRHRYECNVRVAGAEQIGAVAAAPRGRVPTGGGGELGRTWFDP